MNEKEKLKKIKLLVSKYRKEIIDLEESEIFNKLEMEKKQTISVLSNVILDIKSILNAN